MRRASFLKAGDARRVTMGLRCNMAHYELIAEKGNQKIFIVKPGRFLESIKLAWYVIRYPDRTPVLIVVDKNWCEANMDSDELSISSDILLHSAE